MSTFGLTCNLKSPDRNKQFISNIPRMLLYSSVDWFKLYLFDFIVDIYNTCIRHICHRI